MTQWTPDFTRAPDSARQAWRAITASKSVAAIIAAELSDDQDAIVAQLLPSLIASARHVAAARAAAT